MLPLFVRRFDLDSVRDSVTCGQRLAFFGHFIRKEVGDGAAGVGWSHLGRQRWMMEEMKSKLGCCRLAKRDHILFICNECDNSD